MRKSQKPTSSLTTFIFPSQSPNCKHFEQFFWISLLVLSFEKSISIFFTLRQKIFHIHWQRRRISISNLSEQLFSNNGGITVQLLWPRYFASLQLYKLLNYNKTSTKPFKNILNLLPVIVIVRDEVLWKLMSLHPSSTALTTHQTSRPALTISQVIDRLISSAKRTLQITMSVRYIYNFHLRKTIWIW